MPAKICKTHFFRFLTGVVQNNGERSLAFNVSKMLLVPIQLTISLAYLFFLSVDSPYHATKSDMDAQAEKPLILCRDFIYIDDVVSAYLTVITKKNLTEKWFTEYEVGSGDSITIRKFVETVHKISDSKTHLEFGAIPYRKGEVMNSQADVSALKALGWRCDVNLENGLKQTIKIANK